MKVASTQRRAKSMFSVSMLVQCIRAQNNPSTFIFPGHEGSFVLLKSFYLDILIQNEKKG